MRAVLWEPAFRYRLARHPEALPVLAIAGCWLASIWLDAGRGDHRPPTHDAHAWFLGFLRPLVMTIAMMGPAMVPPLRYVAQNSLRWRRQRAMFEFAAGYLFVWVVFETFAMALLRAAGLESRVAATAGCLMLAALWQLGSLKQRCLRNCHRGLALPPVGLAADVRTLVFGLRNGIACLGSCWCIMLTMLCASSPHLSLLLAGTIVVTAERMTARPRRLAIVLGLMFATGALALIGAGTLVPLQISEERRAETR